MGNSIEKQKHETSNSKEQLKSDKLFDKESYTYTNHVRIYDKNGVLIEDKTKEYTINTNDFLERLKNVTCDFIKEYCKVGPCEITENIIILSCVYYEYLYKHLDEGEDRIYGDFFRKHNFSTHQKLMFLLQSVEEIALIIDDNIFGPESLRIKNDVSNYKDVFNCNIRLQNPTI